MSTEHNNGASRPMSIATAILLSTIGLMCGFGIKTVNTNSERIAVVESQLGAINRKLDLLLQKP